VKERFGFSEMDLLGIFDAQNLEPLPQRAAELENVIISAIEEHGVNIRRYETLEEFLSDQK
jgi:hypothetical protein